MLSARRFSRLALIAAAAASLAACATVDRKPGSSASAGGYKVGKPYQVNGVWYVPREQPNYNEVGTASWYGDAFHMKATANGERFDMREVSGAHTTLPLPSIVEVTNLENGRKLRVRLNDRGPFAGNRIIDLSREAARELDFERKGLARVRVRYVGPAPLLGPAAGVRVARASPPRSAPASVQVANASPPARRPSASPAPSSESYREQAAFSGPPPPAAAYAQDVPPPPPPPPPPVGVAYRIQAGAFLEQDRAQRVVDQLAGVGRAVIEPMERDGVTLYRVMLAGPPDELQAYGLRQRVADAGFADARVLGPY